MAIATSRPAVSARRIADPFALRPPIGRVWGAELEAAGATGVCDAPDGVTAVLERYLAP